MTAHQTQLGKGFVVRKACQLQMYTLKHGEEKKKEGGETQELHGTQKSGRRIVSGAQRERGGGCEGVLGVPTPATASARTLAEADREAPGAPSAAGAVQTLCTQTRERSRRNSRTRRKGVRARADPGGKRRESRGSGGRHLRTARGRDREPGSWSRRGKHGDREEAKPT